MKKLLLILLLVVFVAGCSGSSSSDKKASETTTTTVKVDRDDDEDLLLDLIPDATRFGTGIQEISRKNISYKEAYNGDNREACDGVINAGIRVKPFAFADGFYRSSLYDFVYYLTSFRSESEIKKWFRILEDNLDECDNEYVEYPSATVLNQKVSPREVEGADDASARFIRYYTPGTTTQTYSEYSYIVIVDRFAFECRRYLEADAIKDCEEIVDDYLDEVED